jgi:hypothetical protein
MGKQKVKPNYRRRMLRLPDLDHCTRAILNSLGSPASRQMYEYAIDQFIACYCSEPRLAFNRIVVMRYRLYLESRHLAANTINQQLAAVRRLAHEAAAAGLLSPELAAGISRSCAKLCHDRGGELEQIQFLLGHASVQTTERYLGCKQNLGHPVNHLFDLGTNSGEQAEHVESVPGNGANQAVEKTLEPG